MNYIAWLILSVITGLVCYFIARKKGRNVALWFFAGVIFNVFALTAVTIVKNQKIKKGG